jgi:thiamine kinase-like enzyme
VAGNLIDGPGGITLIDWQCPASGDPTEDVATFLSPAMQWLYRGRVLSPPETEAFLSAYPDPDVTTRYLRLRPLYRWRMAAHCLWKADRGAPDYEQALAAELAS